MANDHDPVVSFKNPKNDTAPRLRTISLNTEGLHVVRKLGSEVKSSNEPLMLQLLFIIFILDDSNKKSKDGDQKKDEIGNFRKKPINNNNNTYSGQ